MNKFTLKFHKCKYKLNNVLTKIKIFWVKLSYLGIKNYKPGDSHEGFFEKNKPDSILKINDILNRGCCSTLENFIQKFFL